VARVSGRGGEAAAGRKRVTTRRADREPGWCCPPGRSASSS
jgi:hypothetical protein